MAHSSQVRTRGGGSVCEGVAAAMFVESVNTRTVPRIPVLSEGRQLGAQTAKAQLETEVLETPLKR